MNQLPITIAHLVHYTLPEKIQRGSSVGSFGLYGKRLRHLCV